MKQRILRMALWLGVIGMAVVIFLLSAQTGDVSTASSDSIVLPLLRLIRRVRALSAKEADKERSTDQNECYTIHYDNGLATAEFDGYPF